MVLLTFLCTQRKGGKEASKIQHKIRGLFPKDPGERPWTEISALALGSFKKWAKKKRPQTDKTRPSMTGTKRSRKIQALSLGIDTAKTQTFQHYLVGRSYHTTQNSRSWQIDRFWTVKKKRRQEKRHGENVHYNASYFARKRSDNFCYLGIKEVS